MQILSHLWKNTTHSLSPLTYVEKIVFLGFLLISVFFPTSPFKINLNNPLNICTIIWALHFFRFSPLVLCSLIFFKILHVSNSIEPFNTLLKYHISKTYTTYNHALTGQLILLTTSDYFNKNTCFHGLSAVSVDQFVITHGRFFYNAILYFYNLIFSSFDKVKIFFEFLANPCQTPISMRDRELR